MQKACMCVFKYLNLTAARLKYNIEEALLLPPWKVQELREREGETAATALQCQWESGGATETRKRQKRSDRAISDDNFIATDSQLEFLWQQ